MRCDLQSILAHLHQTSPACAADSVLSLPKQRSLCYSARRGPLPTTPPKPRNIPGTSKHQPIFPKHMGKRDLGEKVPAQQVPGGCRVAGPRLSKPSRCKDTGYARTQGPCPKTPRWDLGDVREVGGGAEGGSRMGAGLRRGTGSLSGALGAR